MAPRYMKRPAYARGACKSPVCGKLTKRRPGGRGWFHYCSEACSIDTDVRCGWHVRGHVGDRDKGVCSECKCDTRRLKRVAAHLARTLYPANHWNHHHSVRRWLLLLVGFKQTDQSLWEADHVVPVIERPDDDLPCGLDGYQTLCQPCHRIESAALAKRRARRRPKKKRGRIKSRPLRSGRKLQSRGFGA